MAINVIERQTPILNVVDECSCINKQPRVGTGIHAHYCRSFVDFKVLPQVDTSKGGQSVTSVLSFQFFV